MKFLSETLLDVLYRCIQIRMMWVINARWKIFGRRVAGAIIFRTIPTRETGRSSF